MATQEEYSGRDDTGNGDGRSGGTGPGSHVSRAGAAGGPGSPDLALEYSLLGNPGRQVVLFLHGITGSRNYFFKKVRRLTRHYRLLLPDLPGFGDSPKPRTAYTLDFYRDTVRKTIVAAGCHREPIHIVGHSLGALIALEYAVRYPEQVDRMVWLSLPRFQNPRAAHEFFWKGSPNYRRLLNEHSMAENVAQWKRTGLPMIARYLFRIPLSVVRDSRKFTLNSLTSTLENCLLNYRVDPVLGQLEPRPVLLLHGRKDQVAPFCNVEELPGSYRYMQLVAIQESGHHIFLTHTRSCMRLIEQHLGDGSIGHANPAPTMRHPIGDLV